MDSSISNFELSASTVRVGSDSDPNSEKSDNFEELLESDALSTGSSGKNSDDDFDNNLPETVTLLRNSETGAKVYLVGTAHFSKESQDDVVKVIQTVRPHIVMLELCSARTSILSLDEATLLEEAKNINTDKILTSIRTNGLYNGMMYILLLNMSAHITKETGMAPGGEFRVACKEVAKLPNCEVHLGDRPFQVTLKRALGSLTWFQTAKLSWHLLTSKEPISKEEIENSKKRDMLEQLIAEMAGEFPALSQVFVEERDIYLTHSLQLAATGKLCTHHTKHVAEPLRIVGVVGIGHVVGISRLWSVDQHSYIGDILTIPPPSFLSKAFKVTVRLSLLSFGGYLVYRYVPMPKIFRESSQKFIDKVLISIKTKHF